jgi:hypothetical protein
MAYEIHIRRPAESISLAEWLAAVDATEGVRRLNGDVTIENPTTGETITIPSSGGDAEFLLAEEATWIVAFRWHSESGAISFRAPPSFGDSESGLLATARELALRLDAQLTGDEGEVYE